MYLKLTEVNTNVFNIGNAYLQIWAMSDEQTYTGNEFVDKGGFLNTGLGDRKHFRK